MCCKVLSCADLWMTHFVLIPSVSLFTIHSPHVSQVIFEMTHLPIANKLFASFNLPSRSKSMTRSSKVWRFKKISVLIIPFHLFYICWRFYQKTSEKITTILLWLHDFQIFTHQACWKQNTCESTLVKIFPDRLWLSAVPRGKQTNKLR